MTCLSLASLRAVSSAVKRSAGSRSQCAASAIAMLAVSNPAPLSHAQDFLQDERTCFFATARARTDVEFRDGTAGASRCAADLGARERNDETRVDACRRRYG